jgi:hypothetical protein
MDKLKFYQQVFGERFTPAGLLMDHAQKGSQFYGA